MREHIRIIILAEFDPSGRTGGDHRKNTVVLNSFNKLIRFLNNCEISGKISIEYLIESEPTQCGDHFSFHVGSDGHTEAFAQRGSDRRGGLNYNMLGWIGKSSPNLISIIFFDKSAGRTNCNALTTGYAGNLAQIDFESSADAGIHTSVIRTYYRYVLLAANSDTAAAEYALVVVTNEVRSACIKLIMRLISIKTALLNSVFTTKLLKLAVCGTRAGEAFLFMGREHKLKSGFSCLLYLCGIGLYFHTL